jgi:hypothetical protein
MSAIIPFPVPGEVLFEPVKKESSLALREPIAVQPSPSLEPGQQLWKLSAQAVSSNDRTVRPGAVSGRFAGWGNQLYCRTSSSASKRRRRTGGDEGRQWRRID